MTEPNEFELAAREEKAQKLAAHLRAVHESLPPRLPLVEWAKQTFLPWEALAKTAGVRPPSPLTIQRVLELLEESPQEVAV